MTLSIIDDILIAQRPHAAPVAIAPAGWAEHEQAARLVYRTETAAAVAGGQISRDAAVRLGEKFGLLAKAA